MGVEVAEIMGFLRSPGGKLVALQDVHWLHDPHFRVTGAK